MAGVRDRRPDRRVRLQAPYVWDATLTAGKYAFSVYGPDGFLTSFAGPVVPAGQDSGQVPVVTATLRSGTVELALANEGQQRSPIP